MRPLAIIVVTVAIGLSAAGGLYYYKTYGDKTGGEPARKPAAGPPPPSRRGGPPGGFAVPVEAVAARHGRLTRSILVVGTLRSDRSVVVRPEIAGRIAGIHFREGQRVAKGTKLVTLDDSIAQAEVAQARASLALSEANFRRAKDLLGRGVGTVRSRDEALAKLRIDRAALLLAEARLEKTVISAPFGGIVGLRRVDRGDFVTVGEDIANLEDIDPMKVDFRVPEIYLGALGAGQRITVTADPWPGQSFVGEVYAIDPLIDERGRSVVIRARLENAGGVLRPGLFVRVRLILTVREDAVLVPEEALVPVGNDRRVFRVVDGKAALTPVRTGLRQKGEVEVLDGVAAGEMVVTAGQLKLRDGVPVRIAPPVRIVPKARAAARRPPGTSGADDNSGAPREVLDR